MPKGECRKVKSLLEFSFCTIHLLQHCDRCAYFMLIIDYLPLDNQQKFGDPQFKYDVYHYIFLNFWWLI